MAERPYEDDVEDESMSDYVFFRNRPEWKDVTPVEQDDGPYSAVKIEYSEKFKDAFDYLRAVIKSGEKSTRALDLTSAAIDLNAANYTVWQYRRDIIEALQICGKISNGKFKDEFQEEFNFSQEIIKENPKNYQVWHHRKVLVGWAAGYDEVTGKHQIEDRKDALFLLQQELGLTAELLGRDAKNYHAWQHRQWVLSVFGIFDEELAYTAELIKADVRNNSAWNHRYFTVKNLLQSDSEVLSKEEAFAIDRIQEALSNESPWSYLRGVLELKGSLGVETDFTNKCKEYITQNTVSVPLRAFLLDVYETKLEKGTASQADIHHAIEVCDSLTTTLDAIRKGYWSFKKKVFETKSSSVMSNDNE